MYELSLESKFRVGDRVFALDHDTKSEKFKIKRGIITKIKFSVGERDEIMYTAKFITDSDRVKFDSLFDDEAFTLEEAQQKITDEINRLKKMRENLENM